jgi:hypothetical protein
MQKFDCRTRYQRGPGMFSSRFYGGCLKTLLVFLIAGTVLLTSCGGGTQTPSGVQVIQPLEGNWQFTMANPADQSYLGGLQGGFLKQKSDNTLNGAAVYSVALPSQNVGSPPVICNSGSAVITGNISGQNVTLTAVAGSQTFTLTGSANTDHTLITGTYSTTDGGGCGTVQSNLQWSAKFVPIISGPIGGVFHSVGGPAGLANQNFAVTGFLTEGPNIGASNATLTGTLNFIDPISQLSIYPCFDTASVNGQISGSTIILQIIGNDGLNAGQIGGSAGSGIGTVTFDSTATGGVLHSISTPSYAVNTKSCAGAGLGNPGDAGNICLSVNSTACDQPITMTPPSITFPAQVLGAAPTTQTVTILNTNPGGPAIGNLSLQLLADAGPFGGPSDFTGLPNFTEKDNCSSSPGSPFSLMAGQSCTATITFNPQQSCPWVPIGNPPSVLGAAPGVCPLPLLARLSLNSPASVDNNTTFSVPLKGPGMSAIVPSTPELDFGAEPVGQASLPQPLSFINRSNHPVQILPVSNTPCTNPLPRPLEDTSPVSGLQIISNGTNAVTSITADQDQQTVFYNCDIDATSHQPNFQITSDSCSGVLLAAQSSCTLQISYAPQPNTNLSQSLDYFLQLNTLQCTSSVTTNCEIDAGRFPVELKANAPSPLRMSPAAGLDFALQPLGKSSDPKTITLFNDPSDPNARTITFSGNQVRGDYSERDDCGATLAPGATCTMTITFKPNVEGLDPGSITVTYTPSQFQTIFLRGTGQ